MFHAVLLTVAAAVCPMQDAVLADAADAIESTYVLPGAGARIAADVRAWADQGRYRAWCADPQAFLERLNRDLDAHDGHFHVARPDTSGEEPDWLAAWRAGAVAANAGVREVRVLEGNIGYLRLASFYPWDQAGVKLAAAFALVADTDGLVLDLRHNGGGDAQTADQLVRAFTDDEVRAVQRIERREGSREDTLPQRQLPAYDRPLVVLVDRRSGSAAEFVAYSLQALGRAHVVGARSGGVAHMLGDARPLAHGYRILVPEARPVNLHTGGNWEGGGVEPDVAGGDDPLFIARRLLEGAAAER